VLSLLPTWLDPEHLARTFGLAGIGAIVFAESGLLIGMFLPGDSLLFTAGVLAAAGILPIGPLVLICIVAAIAGDAVGYWFGAKTGPAIFRREDSRVFRRSHLERARAFYDKHGGRTIVLARFVPIVRTLAPIVAGAAGMRYKRFAAFNMVGGFLWGGGVTLAGYGLGSAIPDIDRYLLPVIAVIVLVSVIPVALEAQKHRRSKHTAVPVEPTEAPELPGE
jgi:membrane-associated protein